MAGLTPSSLFGPHFSSSVKWDRRSPHGTTDQEGGRRLQVPAHSRRAGNRAPALNADGTEGVTDQKRLTRAARGTLSPPVPSDPFTAGLRGTSQGPLKLVTAQGSRRPSVTQALRSLWALQ